MGRRDLTGGKGYSRKEGTACAKAHRPERVWCAQCSAMTEGLLVVISVVDTVRETGPCPSRMTHVFGGGQGDIEKGKQERLLLGLEGCFRVSESERRKERESLPGGTEHALGCGLNEEIVQAGEHGMWKGCWRRLESPTGKAG